jgi:hypothetical protein
MKYCNKNYFWLSVITTILLLVTQNEMLFCETKTIDLSNDKVITITLSPFYTDDDRGDDDGFFIGEKFGMQISAEINDPKVRAEIKDCTLEWCLKSIKFTYYLPNEAETAWEPVDETTFTDNETLKKDEYYHPIIIARPLGEWGQCAKWNIVKNTENKNEEASTFLSPGNWDMEFEIEFRGKHNDIEDCMVQAGKRETKSTKIKYIIGMVVDNFAVEGTDDMINTQFGVIDKKANVTVERMFDPRAIFRVNYQIDWAIDNNAGLVEMDFIRLWQGNSLSIFQSGDSDNITVSPVKRITGTSNQYSIAIDRNTLGNNEQVMSNFYLKAGVGPVTENKIIERAKISLTPFNQSIVLNVVRINYNAIDGAIQENLNNKVQGTEGRYFVNNSYLNVLRLWW